MHEPNSGAARRLARLQRVLAGRQARLAATITGHAQEVAPSSLLDHLRRHGYLVALLLAATAALPTVVGVTWRSRKLLTDVALNGLGVWKLRRRFDAARSTESGR